MGAITLTTLRALAREIADQTGGTLVSDSANSLDYYINEGLGRLHHMLVEAYGEEYISLSQQQTTTTATDYTLPTDFYKLYGVDLSVGTGGPTRTLTKFRRAERNAYNDSLLALQPIPRYQLTGNILRLYPAPSAGWTITIFYAPAATKLVAPSDTYTCPASWENFIANWAAMRILAKEESDISAVKLALDAITADIMEAKEQRDLANPQGVVDMDLVDFDRVFRWRI